MKKAATVFILFLFLCLPCFSQASSEDAASDYRPYFPSFPPLTPQEMMKFARKGAEFLENGGDIQEFNKNPGKFTKGTFLDFRYLAVVDCKTNTVLANPWLPKIVNIKGLLTAVKDAWGRAYMLEICTAAKNNPKGAWNVIFIKKPGESIVDLFYQYVIQVKNTDLIVGVFSRNLKVESYLGQQARDEEKALNSMVK